MSTLGHDAKGNITSDGSYTYTYSSENLLTSLTNPAGAVQTSSTYAYDPLMRLANVDSSNSGLDVQLAYDGHEIVFEALSGNRTRRYVFGPGVDEPLVAYLVTSTGTTRSWYQADERGSIIRLSADNGVPNSAVGRFDEYGVGAGVSRFHYTGQYWLGDSNLHYYRARIYDPRLGRFLQADPIGYQAGMNLYAYVGGDPVNFTDPLGLVDAPTGTRIPGGSTNDSGGVGYLPSDIPGAPPIAYKSGRVRLCVQNCGPAEGGIDENGDPIIIVTAPVYEWVSTGLGFFVRDGRYLKNPYFRKSRYSDSFDVATGVLFAGPLVVIAGVETGGAIVAVRTAAMNPASKLFARRTGMLNRNDIVRLGQGWKGSAQQGKTVFRVAIGHKGWPTPPGLPSFPWHLP